MKFKGVNAKCPCRFCTMKAVKRKVGETTTYYMTRKADRAKDNPNYGSLPLRQHSETARLAEQIECTSDNEERDTLKEDWGINGRVRTVPFRITT